jgi:hypothetical protein
MPEFIKYLIDAAVGFALVAALLVVFAVDRFFFAADAETANTLANVTATEEKGRDVKRLKLAVTPSAISTDFKTMKASKWDDMGKLLDELGEGYKHDAITMEDACSLNKLSQYDVVFLTCAPGQEEQLREVLPAYVAQGGILYASDWRFDAIANAFPREVAPNLKGEGADQELEADIVDAGLRDHLKTDKIHLRFDLREWKTAAFGGPRVKVLLQGRYRKDRTNEMVTAPLMVKFQIGKGTVVFTSFHNEKQNSRIEKELLQYLVYSLVTAGIDAEVNTQMDKGGFTPQRSNLLSTPTSQTTEPKTYTNKNAGGALRFVLGMRNEGAKLRLNIRSPDGKTYAKVSESTLIVDVADAVAGDWTYTVTAVSLPYANFPFTVTVGEKR